MSESALTALIFPGQGSQEPGMRDTVARARPDLLEWACELAGDDPFERVEEGTRFAQPAIYCASIAAWELVERPEALCAAGHSLGELAALAVAGALEVEDGLRLAARRGALMQKAADRAGGGMLALLGDGERARALARSNDLTLANHNAPQQLVVSGGVEALEAARAGAREAGLRAMRLPVRGAFHSREMEPAVAGFRRVLESVRFRDPALPVISCASAREFEDAREELAAALVRPVRWRETLLALRERGAERFLEPGPGRVLSRLVERNLSPPLAAVEPSHA